MADNTMRAINFLLCCAMQRSIVKEEAINASIAARE